MERKKHKRKTSHVVIVTSDAVDANVRQFRIPPWLVKLLIMAGCVLIGAVIGYLAYQAPVLEQAAEASSAAQEALTQMEQEKLTLEEEKKELEIQVESLNNKITILSETVNQKTQAESQLAAQLEQQNTPTEFPLTGSASIQEVTEGDPICILNASVGVMVVATAGGTVMAVNDDTEYGHNVWVDHGNGYITIYRNQGDTSVKAGDKVSQGTTLFIIGENNTVLGYQMMKDGAYINPTEMLVISG